MSTTYDRALEAIQERTATVGVIGLGYVGLPLCDALHAGGLAVLGFDTDPAKIEALRAGEPYIGHLGRELPERLAASERFEPTSDFERLAEVDVILVCVPTPLAPDKEPDLRFVTDTGRAIGRALREGHLVVLESTTYPGTTRGAFLASVLEAHAGALESGEGFFVAYSPEREDPGSRTHATRAIPKLVGGLDERATRLAAEVYRIGFDEVVEVSSAEVAEAAKLLENTFRAVNIALVNELKVILDAMEVDVWEVVRAAATKPFGFMPFFPGPGLGGHCIPIDPFYLAWKAREVDRPTRFIELAGVINTEMPRYVLNRIAEGLARRSRTLRGASVLVVGLAYKRDVDDTRESPSFVLIEELRRAGAEVAYHDPLVPIAPRTRRYDLGMESVELTPGRIAASDAVLIATDHSCIDYAAIAAHARLVVDTRDAMRGHEDALGDRLLRA
ncbi:MAG: nucleotide sugar dehydrogenase [Planctomycetota bacterium]